LKKLILLLLLISSLFAEAKVYVGVSAGVFNETFSNIDASTSSAMSTVKIGYGNIKSYAVEFSLDYAYNRSKIFSSSPDVSKDGDKYGFNINLLKSFDWDIYVLPFVKVGFGTGILNIDRILQKDLSYGSFQLTLGTFVPISKSFDLELGYELRSTTYKGIDYIATKTSYDSVSNIAYMGINYRF